MPTVEDRLATLEKQNKSMAVLLQRTASIANALEGRPSDATLSLPHNDSWLFADNVDGSHPLNLRYVIASNVTKIVSARLSFHLAPYRTYNSVAVSSTGTGTSHNHSHNHGAHLHDTFDIGGVPPALTNTTWFAGPSGTNPIVLPTPNAGTTSPLQSYNTTPTTDATAEATHTHPITATIGLGVTEGAVATGLTISFDGVDQTAILGGPFSADQIELNVRQYFQTAGAVYHTIALQPSGLGRIEAHLRLGYFASAGQLV